MKRLLLLLPFYFWVFLPLHAQTINLGGAWDLSLSDSTRFDDYVMLPGSLLTNGKGNPVNVYTPWTGSLYDSSFYFNPYMEKYRHEGQMKFPFFLTPERHYVGVAWYHKTVYVPRSWRKQRVTLFLERPHIETTVYVNGQSVGHQMSLSVPHTYDVTSQLRYGEKNDLLIRVYNGIENVGVGQDSHSVTDQTQGNWNGIVGRMELRAHRKKLNIKHVRLVPDVNTHSVRVTVEMENHVDGFRVLPDRNYYVSVTAHSLVGTGKAPIFARGVKEALGRKKTFVLDLGPKARLWDEFSPNLYRLEVKAGDDVYETIFGLREVGIQGSQLLINGRPLFLRGTVENCCFPETGFPPTNVEAWLTVMRKCKEYGLNHIRFHSYCPPDAAFTAADLVGIYLQLEGPSWPNHGVKLRRGQKIDQYLLDESKRIIDTYGHHPSFLFMAAGNEPAGDWVSYCNDWVKEMKQYDPTKLYAGASVGGGWAWDSGAEFHVKAGARGLDWDKAMPQADDDYYQQILFPRNYRDTVPNHSPIVTHEQGQWCAFPDFKETAQYTGAYKARNFEIFQDLLADNGMASQAEKFLMASGKLQVLAYKYEIERHLRTPEYAGFQLLGLNDYSGQGTALVGPLNVHWREKGYCTAQDWTQFCCAVVPLARFPRFVFTSGDTLRVPVELYCALSAPIADAPVSYAITDEHQQTYAEGELAKMQIPVGRNISVGTVTYPLAAITQPVKLTLTVSLSDKLKNHWDFWVYPETTKPAPLLSGRTGRGSFLETDSLDAHALQVLQQGGDVLLTAAGRVRFGNDVRHNYLPVFWNTSWFKMRPPHTTGAYIQREHPVFRDFPTDDWQNLNWWELTNRAQVMNLAEFPASYQPIVQPIDTWHVSRKLGMLIEVRVLNGRLLMTTMDITSRLDRRPVARQLRHCILNYMQSPDFQPTVTVSPEVIRHLYEREAPKVDMFTNDSPDELKPKIGG